MKAPIALIAFQALLLAVFVLGDIGFDKPGRFGLDFGHALLLIALYGVAFVTGLVWFVRRRLWRALCTQVAIPVAFVVIAAAMLVISQGTGADA